MALIIFLSLYFSKRKKSYRFYKLDDYPLSFFFGEKREIITDIKKLDGFLEREREREKKIQGYMSRKVSLDCIVIHFIPEPTAINWVAFACSSDLVNSSSPLIIIIVF
jgi:hypothetical protein